MPCPKLYNARNCTQNILGKVLSVQFVLYNVQTSGLYVNIFIIKAKFALIQSQTYISFLLKTTIKIIDYSPCSH